MIIDLKFASEIFFMSCDAPLLFQKVTVHVIQFVLDDFWCQMPQILLKNRWNTHCVGWQFMFCVGWQSI